MSGEPTPARAPLHQEPEGTPTLLIVAALLGTVCAGTLLIGAAFLVLHEREGRLRPSRQFDEQALHLRDRVSGVLQQPFEIPHARPSERAEQEEALHRFGWVDRRRGIVQIPIEEAMRMIAGGKAPSGDGPGGGR
ncbi:MAG TPA: hypothetical protein VIF57_21900 [Polyangia bacterium]|jgi:hypothetical protein